jgi:hypothetical protein
VTDEFLALSQDSAIDLSEWNLILSEPVHTATGKPQQSPQLAGNRKKRFKTNNNTSISLSTSACETSMGDLFGGLKKLKKFYFKPYLIYKCLICQRKMNQFDLNHWLQHDQETHHKLFDSSVKCVNYQHITCVKVSLISNLYFLYPEV